MKLWNVTSAILGVFLLLYLSGCQQKVTKTVPASEESLFSVDETQSTTDETEDFDEMMREEKIAVATEEDVNLSFANIYFDFDRYELSSNARETLADHARMLQSNPKVKLLIEGHCDERGTIEYNLALGERRANAVRKYLLNYGLPTERFSVISYGKEKPQDSRHTEEAWSQNRRAVFIITQQ